ncbi:O-antigen ligase family protein [Isachenkonia alkalipeptolytica]|uniref:O-antigen ligase family protein n=1 Tax=Isachenkonia alkalipeptolytica TaxID=2565777 RepID=A0AA43XMM0_9CLOT|nr:O-antigen ligase family protein [Isachenkonia alkalipeptolytica]NBG89633.1 O-antigen ligase family protein [Isachenkonia alkalipeptolytica]
MEKVKGMGKNIFKRLQIFRRDIKEMKRISELIDYIPDGVIEKVGMGLLILWAASPFHYMFRSLFLEHHDPSFVGMNYLDLSIGWHTLLQQIGFLGIFIGILGGIKSLRQGRSLYALFFGSKHRALGTLLLGMLLWSILATYHSTNPRLSFNGTFHRRDGLVTYFAYGGIFLAGLMVRTTRYRKVILEVFNGGALALSVLLLVNYPMVNGLLSLSSRSAVFYNRNHFGYYQCLAIMVTLVLMYMEKPGRKKRMFRYLSFSLLVAALIENGSFGPYLATMMGLGFLAAVTIVLHRNLIKPMGVVLALFIFLSLGMNIQNGYLQERFSFLSSDVNSILEGEEEVQKAGTNRWGLWVSGVKFAGEEPLFGYGPDNLGERYKEEYEDRDWYYSDRPHNEVIQFAASIGIPGALFYVGAVLIFLYAFIQKGKKNTPFDSAITAALITYWCSSMFGNTMYYTTPFFFLVWSLAVKGLDPTYESATDSTKDKELLKQ